MRFKYDQKSDRQVLRFLNAVAGKIKWKIAIETGIQVLLGFGGVATALLLRTLVNSAQIGRKDLFWPSLLELALLSVGVLILGAVQRYLHENIRSQLENRMMQQMFDSLLSGDFAHVTQVHSAQWMNTLTSDTQIVAGHMSELLPSAARMSIQLIGALGALLALEPRLAWLILPSGVLLLIFSTSFRRKMKKLHKDIQESSGALRTELQEGLTGLTVVKAYASEEKISRMASAKMENYKKYRIKKAKFSAICNFGFGILMRGIYVLGAAFCGIEIINGYMGAGNLVAIMQLVGQVQGPMANISGLLPRYYSMISSAERLIEAEKIEREPGEEPVTAEAAAKFYQENLEEISFKDVSFTYPGDSISVLNHFSLFIKPKTAVAFTGQSGCGKSTVLRLMLGLYRPQAGQCALIESQGVMQEPRKFRRLFAYVPQGKFFMSGTIREIVTFARSDQTRDEAALWEALRIACADAFVRELTMGLDTCLGEQGSGLSEGQIQRLSIARAVYSQRPVLLLDEATSALDEETEKQVLENLKDLKDRTVFIVTHRPAVLKICDRVVEF